MLVSILITNYNKAPFLHEAISSCLNQKFDNFEVLLIDDGSTDGTFDWIKSKYPSIKLLESLKPSKSLKGYSPKGVSVARNVGIKQSKGDWIALLDSDDEWIPDKLIKQVQLLKKNVIHNNFYLENNGATTLENRRLLATKAFHVSSHYDGAIFNYFNTDETYLKTSVANGQILRYGENPHQKGIFYGDFNSIFTQANGKELSYNNFLDIDSAINLMNEFQLDSPTFAILKHNNACGLAIRNSLLEAYKDALAADPVSAFGGVLISNKLIDLSTAEEINKLFCEVVIAPSYEKKALELLCTKKNRIILIKKETKLSNDSIRTCLNGVLYQGKDNITDTKSNFKTCTIKHPTEKEIQDMIFASKICKHTKSNTIVLVKDKQLISSGTGQTSRVDALKQAIEKSINFSFDLNGAVMASDAFFPFPDCVEIAHNQGISSVIQPGGSIKDNLSIDYCNKNNLSMVLTGIRHFKH